MVATIRDAIGKAIVRGPSYDPQYAVDMCDVLFSNKLLHDVPLLLATYCGGIDCEDTEIFVTRLEYLLGDLGMAGGQQNVDRDRALVMRRFTELAAAFGTTHARIWRGETFSLNRLCRRWLAEGGGIDPLTLRRIFEAMTGIHCGHFFQNEEFQASPAAATLEDFLKSQDAHLYEDGARKFFGHRIPRLPL